MNHLINIRCGRECHTLVIDEIQCWKVTEYHSYSTTLVYLRGCDSPLVIDGNHGLVLSDAVGKRRPSRSEEGA